MFRSNIIRKEVMKVVNARIADAQLGYDNTVLGLETAHFQAVADLKAKLTSDKDGVAKRWKNLK